MQKQRFTRTQVIEIIDALLQNPDVLNDAMTNESTDHTASTLLASAEIVVEDDPADKRPTTNLTLMLEGKLLEFQAGIYERNQRRYNPAELEGAGFDFKQGVRSLGECIEYILQREGSDQSTNSLIGFCQEAQDFPGESFEKQGYASRHGAFEDMLAQVRQTTGGDD